MLNGSNEVPIARCGDPVVVEVGSEGVLDGSASVDPEESPSYQWRIRSDLLAAILY